MKKGHEKTIKRLFIFLSLGWFFVPFITRAFSVAPAKVELSLSPGEKSTGILQVENASSNIESYDISSQLFGSEGEDGRQRFIDSSVNDLSSWIVPQRSRFELEPGAATTVSYEIRVPSSAKPGGHYAVLFVSSKSGALESSPQVATIARIGVLFFATVHGRIEERAQFYETRRLFGTVFDPEIRFVARIQNAGNVHIRPEGFLVVENAFGRIVARRAFNSEQGAILPESIRRFSAEWHPEWWKIGKFHATFEATYGARGSLVSSPISFWVIPWRLLMFVAAVTALGSIWFLRYTRR